MASQSLVTGHQSTYQAPVIMHHSMGNKHWVANQSHRGSEQSFSNETQNLQMSDPSIIIDPPSNTWQSTDIHTSQTRQSRRDQPKTKQRTKKMRRYRSSSPSSSSRLSSLASHRRSKRSKRSKHSHKRRRRRSTLSSSSSSSSHSMNE